jgi:CRISPR/Cas system-associated protein Csm6
MNQQWTWGRGEHRKSERLPAVRVTPAQRLRVVEEAQRLGLGEAETIRRAIEAGLAALEEST